LGGEIKMEPEDAMKNAHSGGMVYDKNREGYWRDPEGGKVVTLSQLLDNLPKN